MQGCLWKQKMLQLQVKPTWPKRLAANIGYVKLDGTKDEQLEFKLKLTQVEPEKIYDARNSQLAIRFQDNNIGIQIGDEQIYFDQAVLLLGRRGAVVNQEVLRPEVEIDRNYAAWSAWQVPKFKDEKLVSKVVFIFTRDQERELVTKIKKEFAQPI